MDNFELLERLGTVEAPDLQVTARVAATLEGAAGGDAPRSRRTRYPVRPLLTMAAALVVLVVAAVTIFSNGGGLSAPTTSSWQAGHAFGTGAGTPTGHGTWALVDDALSGSWQQDLSGPPPGYFTCPDATTCFAMSGAYASDSASTATSESLYASTDFGVTWTVYPMPSGFLATSALACSDATHCYAGGTYNAQPVLISTSDGGHSFVTDPLPSSVGTIYSLSCPSAHDCAALVATHADSNSMPLEATFLSTGDGGSHFSNVPILAGDSMDQIACSTDSSCIASGVSDSAGSSDGPTGVTAVTSDTGQSWTPGTMPMGFGGVNDLAQISCADTLHCSVIGAIDMPVANPPSCAGISPPLPKPTGAQPLEQSPAVRTISNLEYRYAMASFKVAGEKSFTCLGGGNGEEIITDIASTVDGGYTWTPELLPSDVPQPQLTGISCPSDSECWASGSNAIAQDAGKSPVGETIDGGSSVLLGTTNAGSSWSRVNFTIPNGAPNFEGQSFLGAGSISCPTVNDCAANGVGAQGAPTAPVYILRTPSDAS
jgi:photosystem II stability/assembly factor-like uncharacterized protein